MKEDSEWQKCLTWHCENGADRPVGVVMVIQPLWSQPRQILYIGLYFMTEKVYSVFLLKIRHVFLECSHNAVLYSGHIIQTLWYGSWPLNQRIHAIHVRFWLKRPVHGAATASYCQLNTVLFLGCMTSLLGAFEAVKSDISIACALIRKLRGKLERPLNLQED